MSDETILALYFTITLYIKVQSPDSTIAFLLFGMTKLAEAGTTGPSNRCTLAMRITTFELIMFI